jgi:hypothetical protein
MSAAYWLRRDWIDAFLNFSACAVCAANGLKKRWPFGEGLL